MVVIPSTEVLAIIVGRGGDDVLVVGGCHHTATDHCGGTTVGRGRGSGPWQRAVAVVAGVYEDGMRGHLCKKYSTDV